jgi:hypothetical protein
MVHKRQQTVMSENVSIGEIIPVSEYNRLALIQYDKQVKDWDYKKGGFPFPQTFSTKFGLHRTKGFVGRTKFGWVFAKTRKEVNEKLKKELW